jgi:hypothetical protein
MEIKIMSSNNRIETQRPVPSAGGSLDTPSIDNPNPYQLQKVMLMQSVSHPPIDTEANGKWLHFSILPSETHAGLEQYPGTSLTTDISKNPGGPFSLPVIVHAGAEISFGTYLTAFQNGDVNNETLHASGPAGVSAKPITANTLPTVVRVFTPTDQLSSPPSGTGTNEQVFKIEISDENGDAISGFVGQFSAMLSFQNGDNIVSCDGLAFYAGSTPDTSTKVTAVTTDKTSAAIDSPIGKTTIQFWVVPDKPQTPLNLPLAIELYADLYSKNRNIGLVILGDLPTTNVDPNVPALRIREELGGGITLTADMPEIHLHLPSLTDIQTYAFLEGDVFLGMIINNVPVGSLTRQHYEASNRGAGIAFTIPAAVLAPLAQKGKETEVNVSYLVYSMSLYASFATTVVT